MFFRGDLVFNTLSSTTLFLWLAIRTVSAQTHESAFGQIRTFELPKKCEESTLMSIERDQSITIASWSQHHQAFYISTIDSNLSSIKIEQKYITTAFEDLYSADLNNDGILDLILVDKESSSISIIMDLSRDTLKINSTTILPFSPEKLIIFDHNQDRRLDLLVWSRKVPGIFPLLGNGKGQFSVGKIIASENMIGSVTCTFINNDNLVDILLWDWIKSDLHVLYGVGKGRYIDQSVFPVQGEVDAIFAVSIIPNHSLDVILKVNQPSEFQIWEVTDFGDFRLLFHVPYTDQLNDCAFSDVNNDSMNDIITTTKSGALQIYLNDNIDPFSDRITYASGENPQKIMIIPNRAKSINNCIIFDKGVGQFIFFENIASKNILVDTVQLSTGLFPEDIISGDFNLDGLADIALTNTKGKSVALYWGSKTLIPNGPYFYSLSDEPQRLAFHSATDSSLHLVFSFPQNQQISYFTFDANNNSISNAFIGCEGDAQLLIAPENSRHASEFVTLNSTNNGENSLSFYEQLVSNTFIERTFRLAAPDVLLGATVSDINNDQYQDILYIYRTGDTSNVELGIAYGDSSYSMKHRAISREFFLPNVSQIFLFLENFDSDSLKDILIQAGSPVEYIMIAQGKGEEIFLDPKIVASGIPMKDRSDLQIVDIDNDGMNDIILASQLEKQIIWFQNKGGYNFIRQDPLFSGSDFSHYIVGDFNGDKIGDLAMTFPRKGIIKIVNGKQFSFRYLKKNRYE